MPDNVATFRITEWYAPQIVDELKGASIRALNRLAKKAINRAKQYTPVDTGRLQESIKVFEISEKNGLINISWGSDVEYALYVELGTVFMTGHYMMTRAQEEVSGELANLLGVEFGSSSVLARF